MGNHGWDIVYGNLFYTFVLFFMKTKCKFLLEKNKDILKGIWGDPNGNENLMDLY